LNPVDDAVGLARVYVDSRNYHKAADLLGAALQTDPHSAPLLVEMARAQLGLGNPSAAASSAYAALLQAPEDVYSMRVYATTLDQLGRRHEALNMAYRAVQADSNSYLTHYTYATLLLNAGHSAQALLVLNEALRLKTADAELHFLAGRILNKLGRVPESTAAYEETLRLDPDHALAAHNIAVNRLNRGSWKRALRGFLGAARMDPELGQQVRRNIGVALIRPLRWSTLLVVLLSYFAIISHEDTSPAAQRIVTAVAIVGLLALLAWVVRLVPRSAHRSVLRAQPMLAVRGGLAVCAVVIGLAAITGVAPAVSLPASVLLLLTAVVLIVAGWLSGT
jgi:tetratricopeptide (TPR) repeat protein